MSLLDTPLPSDPLNLDGLVAIVTGGGTGPPGIASTELTACAPATVTTQCIASAGGSARISARVTAP